LYLFVRPRVGRRVVRQKKCSPMFFTNDQKMSLDVTGTIFA
jgi:hypothetical protein